MKVYRPRPRVVEAARVDDDSVEHILRWGAGHIWSHLSAGREFLSISGPNGRLFADPGDYIVRDASGVFHVYREDKFKAAFEPVVEVDQ